MSQSRGRLRIRLVWRGEVRPVEETRSYSLSVEEAGVECGLLRTSSQACALVLAFVGDYDIQIYR
jgi:hypothetical protein